MIPEPDGCGEEFSAVEAVLYGRHGDGLSVGIQNRRRRGPREMKNF